VAVPPNTRLSAILFRLARGALVMDVEPDLLDRIKLAFSAASAEWTDQVLEPCDMYKFLILPVNHAA